MNVTERRLFQARYTSRTVNAVLVERSGNAELPFRFNAIGDFVISINVDLPNALPFALELTSKLSGQNLLGPVIFENFSGGRTSVAVEKGMRVPSKLFETVMDACLATGIVGSDPRELYELRDDGHFGYSQRIYVGSRKPSGVPLSRQGALSPSASAALELIRRGRHSISQGNLSEAIEQYRSALSAEPARPGAAGAWMDLGVALKDLAEYEEAEACLRKAVEIDAQNGDAWFNLGSLLARNLHRYAEAVEFFKKAIECNPSDEDATCFAAEALTRDSRAGEAMKFLDGRLAQRPDLSKVAAAREQIALEFRRWVERIADGKFGPREDDD